MRSKPCSRVAASLLIAVFSLSGIFADTPPLAKAPFNTSQAQELQQLWAKHLGKEVVHSNSIGMTLKLIPPGEFVMGRTEEQFDEILDIIEKDPEMKKNRGAIITWSMLMMPAHKVRITKPFYMGSTEVTVEQFRQFTEQSGYKTEAEQGLNYGRPYKGGRAMSTWKKPMAWRRNFKQQDNEPVMHLCWNDCMAFCKWLSEKEGVEYSLPSEAEWEYACRAGTTTPWSFGDYADFDQEGNKHAIWSENEQKFEVPQAVAQRQANPFGLYDMHGNMWEYVADWWHRLSYKEAPLNDPVGPDKQSEKGDQRRIIRGSSFDWGRWGGDSAYRMRIVQRSNQHPHMSFRVVMRENGMAAVPPAIDADELRRREKRDPGTNSKEVLSALHASESGALPGQDHPKHLTVDLNDEATMDFVLVPPGSFLMGSAKGPKDERPIHRVVISKPFYMAKYEITQSQWEAVMGPDKRLEQLRSGDNEMTGPGKAMNALSWMACRDFIKKIRAKVPQYSFDLPTEAQWEYACRAGSDSEYSFGDDPFMLGEYAWFEGNMNWFGKPGFQGKAFYHDVGVKKPNGFGLHDMHGGVWEWCKDWYDADYYLNSPLVDPTGPDSGRFRVLRSGSWFRYPKYARSAYRRFFHPEGDGGGLPGAILDFGGRLVINLGDKRPSQNQSAGKTPDSHTTIDYTKLARNLVRYQNNPVIKVGEKGAWDDQTLGCLTVLDDGDRFYYYSDGTQFGKPKKIGMATSKDGIHWTKYENNPLFPGSMPYAIKVGDTFRMYHPGKDEKGKHGLLMKTSQDGFHWSKQRLVMAGGVLDPCVIQVGENRFHLYYCAGGKKTINGKDVWEFKNYVATSADGINWKKIQKPVLPLGSKNAWDNQSHAGPCVLKLEDVFHMWYLGSGSYKGGKNAWRIGHATSPDGITWTKSGKEPVLDTGKAGDWDSGTFLSFDIIFREGKFLFWYAAAPGSHGDETKMKIQIGHGTSK
jgi:formylglycine-generating enzyme required for sulfatase activity